MTTALPVGAAAPGDAGPRRSVSFSGGGIRVAYQVGAYQALLEAGLRFHYYDGTSGGGINLAMLFSGLTPAEMAERWRGLCLADTISFQPLDQYIHSCTLQAMGSADAMRTKVLPYLGVDFAKIRAVAGAEGTFNMLEFSSKEVLVLPHQQLDMDHLIAGFSLPGMFPPVEIGGKLYLDAAFRMDANPNEAVKRGIEEIWVLWALGDAPQWRTGGLGLYMNMLEMVSNGRLTDDMRWIARRNERLAAGRPSDGQERPIRVNVVRSKYPLPLDPDLYLGKVDYATLIDMGYSDARRILLTQPDGGPLGPEALIQETFGVGVIFRETFKGALHFDEIDPATAKGRPHGPDALTLHTTVRIPDVDTFVDQNPRTELFGRIEHPAFAGGAPCSGYDGEFSIEKVSAAETRIVYQLTFLVRGEPHRLVAENVLRDSGFDMVSDLLHLPARLHRGTSRDGAVVAAGNLELGLKGLIELITTLRVTDAPTLAAHTHALTRFGGFFLGRLWQLYGHHAKKG